MTPAASADRRPLDELFAVLGDPTRRAVLEQLVHDGPQTATELAEHFPSTRQSVVKHLRVLAEAGLVTPERSGREVHYRATTARLADAVTWLIGASDGWDRRTERLRDRASTDLGASGPDNETERAQMPD